MNMAKLTAISAASTVVSPFAEARLPAKSVAGPAGHIDHLPGHERGLVAAQKGDDLRDVARYAETAHRDLHCHLLLPFLKLAAEPGRDRPGHLGVDKAGRHRIHGDAVAAELDR